MVALVNFLFESLITKHKLRYVFLGGFLTNVTTYTSESLILHNLFQGLLNMDELILEQPLILFPK